MKSSPSLKPQDVVILLKLALSPHRSFTYAELASELKMSPSEVHDGLKRAHLAGLVDESKRKVFRQALLEFLVYGLKYVFPASPGKIVKGLPTAHSAQPLASHVRSSGEEFVWPDPHGKVRGQEIPPLYRSVPEAARKDPKLYEILSLIDALRVGRTREKSFAKQEIESRLMSVSA